MSHFYLLPRRSALTLLVSQLVITPVFAAGFQINEISPALLGDATAGAAAANNDVSSMFTNPATLSTLESNQFYLGGSEIIPQIKMSNASATHTVNIPGIPPSSISAPVAGVTSQANISKLAFVPDGYASWRLNNRLVAGLALVAPFGLTTRYSSDSVLRFAALDSEVSTVNITPALSYAFNDKFALGLGLQIQYISATFSNFDGPYTGTPADAIIAAKSSTHLTGNSWGYGFTAGALYAPTPHTRLGIGYRSQISEELHGHGQQYVGPGPTVPAPSQNFLFNADTSVKAAVKTPAVLTLSAAQDIYDWTLKASAQVNFWKTFNQLSIYMPEAFATNSTVQTRWRDTVLAAIGADYRVTCDWTLRGGFAYDETPTKGAYRDARIPDSDRFWLTFGATYKATKNWSFDGSYAHIFMRDQNINVTQAIGTNAITTVPLEVNSFSAKYHGSADVIGLAVRYSL